MAANEIIAQIIVDECEQATYNQNNLSLYDDVFIK